MSSDQFNRLDHVMNHGSTETVKKLNSLLREEYLRRLMTVLTWKELDTLIKGSDLQLGIKGEPTPDYEPEVTKVDIPLTTKDLQEPDIEIQLP